MVRLTTAFILLAALPAAALSPPSVSPRLQPGPAEDLAFVLSGTGTHVYECRVSQRGYRWTFVRPDVTLSDGAAAVATQQAPNLIEGSNDRSSVTAVVRATQPAANGALPWTLMAASANSTAGLFGNVSSVQRVNTVGGVAPADGCGELTVGAVANVDFSADYYFYKPRGAA